ncbi:MAG TPA: Fe-S protein assembly chaperone HscA [Polyangiales bacterium]|nr:Fe-S protein assembly chaperone HscA [Polyangiales bacterium]
MALLQIHDPEAKPKAIGIDLGTTNSLVAYVTASGEPVAVRDCDNEALVPSVVHYVKDGRVLVGRDAVALAERFPEDTIVSVKRFMGRGADDPETRRMGTYRFASEAGPVVKFAVAPDRIVTPVEVSAQTLAFLRETAEDELGTIGGAVITVPAYFDDAQRQATKDAGKLAGLEVLRLLNEPTAAALAYGLQEKKNGTFVVYDLGGGTFDVTILVLDDGVFQVRSTGGDSQLGGDDIDRGLAEKILPLLGAQTPHTVRRALNAAKQIKHALTDSETVQAELERDDGTLVDHTVTRAELDEIVAPLAKRTGNAAKRALRDAELTAADIDGVILVGGATRVPAIRRYVAELFGQEPLGSIDPDQVVALGAAIQADLLSGESTNADVLLLDVLPLSLGVETMGGVVERILPRNTPIPAAQAQEFTTYADKQTGFELHVVQGERELAEDCRSLARFTLKGIPPMPAGMARLKVVFRVDADGLLKVEAEEKTTGTRQEVEVRPSYGLTDEEVERMLTDAYEHGEDDVKLRRLREEQVEGKRILSALEQALRVDGTLVEDDEERADIEGAMKRLRRALDGEDHDEIRRRTEDLDHASKAFAGRRMDRSMKKALAGRAASQLESETQDARGIEPHLGSTEH